jgi:2-dehydro-3-deoxygalactonokinase
MVNFSNVAPETAARSADGTGDAWAIALDGGTTNTRARLLHGSRLVATARRAVGVRDTVLERPPSRPAAAPPAAGPANREALVRAVREVVEEVRGAWEKEAIAGRSAGGAPGLAFLVAAGMLSSEVGLVAVPHVLAPAGPDDLARASDIASLPEVDERPILIVPGVRTPTAEGPGGWFDSDVMRGEECETLGARAALIAGGRLAPGQSSVFFWPGSHTKLVEVDSQGRIVRSFTTLAGEILQAVAQHTLLAASLPRVLPDQLDRDAAREGAIAAERHGLGRAAFLVRIAALTSTLDEQGRASFWIGAAIAADVTSLADHPILAADRPVFVGGREPLRTLYTSGLARRRAGTVVALDDSLAETASALGACAVAERRRVLDGASPSRERDRADGPTPPC